MLTYKVAKREVKPFGKKEKETRYYAKRAVRGSMSLRQVEDAIVQKTSLARGDVRNAIISLAEVVNEALLSGLRVDLGELGSFAVEANGKMVLSEKEVNASTIKKPQIRYAPKSEMRTYAQRIRINVEREDNTPGTTTGSAPSSSASGGSASGTPSSGGGVNDSEL